MSITRGQKLLGVFIGPWQARAGSEIAGIAAHSWSYALCYLKFESHEVYELDQRSLRLRSMPAEATNDPLIDSRLPARLQDVLIDSVGDVRVFLTGAMYLENAYLPGGSRLILGDLSEWTLEELQEIQESLIDGQLTHAGLFVNGTTGVSGTETG